MSGLLAGSTGVPAPTPGVISERVPADTLGDILTVRPPTGRVEADPTWDEAPVLLHEVLDGHYHRLVLHSPSIASRARAGQFVMVSVPSRGGAKILLPRPMAIQRRHPERGDIEVTFSIAGRGTAELARIEVGQSLLLTGPLGRGF